MFYKRKIAEAILELCRGPNLSLLHFSGDNASVMNCTFDSPAKILRDAVTDARVVADVYSKHLDTIQELARKLT